MAKKLSKEEHRRRGHAFFQRRWDEIENVIDYDPNWETVIKPEYMQKMREMGNIEYNIKGIFEDEHVMALKPGDVAKSMDDHGRKFIIVRTRLGAWVIFVVSKDVREGRLGDTRSDRDLLYYPVRIAYSRAELVTYIGSPNGIEPGDNKIARNIGQRMELVFEMMLDPSKPIPSLIDHFYISLPKKK